MTQSIHATAAAFWQSSQATADSARFAFKPQTDPCFLVMLDLSNAPDQAATASELITIAMAEQACFSAQGLTGISLWEMTAHAVCASPCHIYLNLDLLTIDPHAQDWGDFKIKPEQVEVQRNELTHAALFKPRLGFILQVQKAALTTLMDMLRTANLVQLSSTIGKTWGEVALGTATLDIYRDAKKQATFSAQDLIALKTAVATK